MPSGVAKSLSRLSRNKILDLCDSWTKSPHCEPYLLTNRDIREIDEEDYLHEPAASRSDLRRLYAAQKENCYNLSSSASASINKENSDANTLSKKDLIDRIVDGDWRRGLSYEQLAAIDFAALEESDTALRWSALRLVPLTQDDAERPAKRRKTSEGDTTTTTASRRALSPLHYPQTTAAEFARNLKTHISPLVKAHCHVHRLAARNLSVVRLCIVPGSPFAPLSTNIPRSEKTALDGSRTLFIALPDSCPYVYVSMSGAGGVSMERSQARTGGGSGKVVQRKVDAAAAKRIVLEAIPKALSRPQQRWALQNTNLTARSLRTMLLLRGNCRPGVTGGVFSGLGCSVLSGGNQKPGLKQTDDVGGEEQGGEVSEHEKHVEQRFGAMNSKNVAKLDRVQFRIKNVLLQRAPTCKRRRGDAEEEQSLSEEIIPITVTFSGSDVFAGLKQLATIYPNLVDLDRLPAAFTGELGTSVITL